MGLSEEGRRRERKLKKGKVRKLVKETKKNEQKKKTNSPKKRFE